MTKRETQRSGSGLSPRAQEIAADIRKINADTRRLIETAMPPCPSNDGTQGEYYQSVGSFTGRVSVQYKCPEGHIFGWNFSKNKGYLISKPDQESTPFEAK